MSELLQSGQHPDADQLSAFLEHVLPAHEQEQTLAHLAVCERCRSVVALSTPPVEETPRPQLVRRRWFSGWNLAGPAAAALAALVLVGVHIRNTSIARSQASPAQVAVTHAPVSVEQLPAPTPPPQAPRHPAAAHGDKAVTKAQVTERAAIHDRSISPLITPAPVAGGVMGGAMALHGVAVDSNPARIILSQHPLPSGLGALSTAANGQQVVAIDANNTPFFSDDGGVHWNVVSPQWNGRAVKVELVSLEHEAAPSNGAVAGVASTAPAVAAGAAALIAGATVKSSITGEVTDTSGASIARAAVVVTNAVTQVAQTTQTDKSGHYKVDNLDPGTYRLAVDATGFNQQQLSGIALNSGRESRVDFTLPPGAVSESVTVQGGNQLAPATPPVKQMIGVNFAAPILPRFEITTDRGERWTSTDRRLWKRK